MYLREKRRNRYRLQQTVYRAVSLVQTVSAGSLPMANVVWRWSFFLLCWLLQFLSLLVC